MRFETRLKEKTKQLGEGKMPEGELLYKKNKKKAMQVHKNAQWESAKGQRVWTCHPVLTKLSMSIGSPKH